MRRIRWTLAAAQDRQGINAYLREHHPRYRQPTLRKLYETICSLKDAPNRGRLVLKPEREVLRVYHGAQNRP